MTAIEELHVVEIARTLGDPVRFSIYKHIVERNEIRCKDIYAKTHVGAPTVSHHLKMLSNAGLIESRRRGQAVYYRSAPAMLQVFLKYFRQLRRIGLAASRRPSEATTPTKNQ